MSGRPGVAWSTLSEEDERLRPLYARVLGLRFVNPGEVLCFVFFEGTVTFAILLAMAELASWWSVLTLPALVAVLVKANDLVAAMVVRKAAQVPKQEQDRFRREVEPVIGRARVPAWSLARQPASSLPFAASPAPAAGAAGVPAGGGTASHPAALGSDATRGEGGPSLGGPHP